MIKITTKIINLKEFYQIIYLDIIAESKGLILFGSVED
mgnify:FL=1